MKKKALGRGLDALLDISDIQTEGSSSINEIELDKIKVNPNQPRHEFNPEALQELADSIAEIGIIQPITLRETADDEYQIIAGERRFRAAQMAGLKTIPAYIRTASDENVMEMALIENIQREDLNSVEIALAYQHLLDQYNLTQERLSERVGKNRATIANYLRLLKLPAEIQMGLQNKQIEMAHARALVSLADPKLQVKVYREILDNDYSVRQVEEMVKSLTQGEAVNVGSKKLKPKGVKMPEEYKLLKQQLTNFFKAKVQLTCSPNWWGTLAPPVRTWVTQNVAALKGKTMCLFQTHGGGGMQSLGRDFAALLPDSKALPPKAFSGSSIKSSVKALEEFAIERISVQ